MIRIRTKITQIRNIGLGNQEVVFIKVTSLLHTGHCSRRLFFNLGKLKGQSHEISDFRFST
jgi:hypothetical protein